MTIPAQSFPQTRFGIAFRVPSEAQTQPGPSSLDQMVKMKGMLEDLLTGLQQLETLLQQSRPEDVKRRD